MGFERILLYNRVTNELRANCSHRNGKVDFTEISLLMQNGFTCKSRTNPQVFLEQMLQLERLGQTCARTKSSRINGSVLEIPTALLFGIFCCSHSDTGGLYMYNVHVFWNSGVAFESAVSVLV